MTKTQYREYIASPAWKVRRLEVLRNHPSCEKCFLPRSLSVRSGVYDQDLHVHHLNYLRLGEELDSDLQVLCARCHEIETFGTSALNWGIPKWLDSESLKLSCRSCQFWALVLADHFDAELSDEQCNQFYDLLLGFKPKQIDAVCTYLMKACVHWPSEEYFYSAIDREIPK